MSQWAPERGPWASGQSYPKPGCQKGGEPSQFSPKFPCSDLAQEPDKAHWGLLRSTGNEDLCSPDVSHIPGLEVQKQCLLFSPDVSQAGGLLSAGAEASLTQAVC